MATRGRKPKPMALRKLTTKSFKKRKDGAISVTKARPSRKASALVPEDKQPKPVLAIPNVPDSLKEDKVGAKAWKKITASLKRMRVLSTDDWAMVESFALAYSRAIKAEEHVREHGIMIQDLSGWKANPAVAMAKAQWQEVRRISIEFGLTPSSRTRIAQLGDQSGDEETENVKDEAGERATAESFLFGKRGRVIGAIGA